MILTQKLITYLTAIQSKVLKGEPINAPDYCPECGNSGSAVKHNSDHLIIEDFRDGALVAFVLICCEGYWTVNPEIAGLPRGNWAPL
jgi:hypothetical protein